MAPAESNYASSKLGFRVCGEGLGLSDLMTVVCALTVQYVCPDCSSFC